MTGIALQEARIPYLLQRLYVILFLVPTWFTASIDELL